MKRYIQLTNSPSKLSIGWILGYMANHPSALDSKWVLSLMTNENDPAIMRLVGHVLLQNNMHSDVLNLAQKVISSDPAHAHCLLVAVKGKTSSTDP